MRGARGRKGEEGSAESTIDVRGETCDWLRGERGGVEEWRSGVGRREREGGGKGGREIWMIDG